MVTTIIENIASKLLAENTEWLSQIRTTGYLNKSQDAGYIQSEELGEIGLTDVEGNSGYIRFQNDQNFKVEEIQPTVTRYAFKYTYLLRLVVLAKTSKVIDLNYLLSMHLNHMEVANIGTASNIKIRALNGGSNSVTVHKTETGKELSNTSFRCFFVDFALIFQDNNKCNYAQLIPTPTPMNCKCTNIYDMGCFGPCEEIELPIEATATGNYTLVTEFNGTQVRLTIEGTEGENLVLNSSNLTPAYIYQCYILDSADEQMEFNTDPSGENYNCFQIQLSA